VRPLIPFLFLLMSAGSSAATDWSLCRAPLIVPQAAPAGESDSLLTEIEAGRLFSPNGRLLEFTGSVRFARGGERIETERLSIDRIEQRVEADGPVLFSADDLRLEAGRLLLQRRSNSGLLDDVRFRLAPNHLRGSARQVRLQGESVSRFEEVRYSTCDPGDEAWSLSASTLVIDRASGRGTATHSVLRLGPVPVFYLPWLQFPIDDRRMSGLLTPVLGDSENDGTSLSLPVYLNLAPNYDMTVTPTFYSRRGDKLDTENRYLFGAHQGSLGLATLDDRVTGTHRWLERWRHEADLPAGIHASLLYQKVSDGDYLEDFEPAPNGKAVDWLKSAAQFTARPLDWQAGLLYERYQALNLAKPVSERPYERWPQVELNRLFSSDNGRWQLDWRNQWTRFRHDANVEGERLWVTPRLSYRKEAPYGFLETGLRLDHAEYRLDQPYNGGTRPARDIPLFSIDGGLVFERLAGADRDQRQTLEPRLYLLYVPYRDQSGQPDFDSSKLPENIDNLFIDNRFAGGDRVGDARQISLSLGTRLFDADDREWLNLTLAQAFWTEPRRVSLDGQTDERKRSPLFARMTYRPDTAWALELAAAWDADTREFDQGDLALRRSGNGRAFNLEYHLRRDKLEQSTLSLVYPVTPAWQLFAKRQYSLRNHKPVENLFGVAWQSCCWGFKLLYREASNRDFTDIDRGVFFELTLKGLGSAGRSIDAIAETAILGYHPAF